MKPFLKTVSLPVLGLAALCVASPAALAAGTIDPLAPQSSSAHPASCAADYHARLKPIAEKELAAYREARATIGEIDPRLPGRLLFASPRRPDLDADARRALSAGETLARRQGRTSFARDANTRWIAERIREDLTDYLSQGPTPFLCAGAAEYLATLRTYAAQGAPSPARLAEDREAQIATASLSLDAAYRAMRPAPLPRFAPKDRPGGLSVEGLRLALDTSFREREGVTRVAARDIPSRISESRIDPDLPPWTAAKKRPLANEAGLSRSLTALLRTAERRGFIAEAEPASNEWRNAHRPILARLASLRTHLDSRAGLIDDPLVRESIRQAVSDIEILDYLNAAVGGRADPLSAALYGTLDAIEAAHSEACTCNAP